MGSFSWPCPRCGQDQKTRAPNGTEVNPRLCAGCEEEVNKEKAREGAEFVDAQVNDVSRTKEARGEKAGKK